QTKDGLRPVAPMTPALPMTPIRPMIGPIGTVAVVAPRPRTDIDLGSDRAAHLPPAATPIAAAPDGRARWLDQDDGGGPRRARDRRRVGGGRRRSFRCGRLGFGRLTETGGARGVPEAPGRNDCARRGGCENHATHYILLPMPLSRSDFLPPTMVGGT